MTAEISIITPMYNAKKFAEKLYSSLVSQDFKNWEWIVVDDCSNDGCEFFLDTLASNDSRIKVVHLQQRGGVSNARNTGIDIAKCELITFIDADDYVSENFLSGLLEFKNADLVIGAKHTIRHDDSGFIEKEFDILDDVEITTKDAVSDYLAKNLFCSLLRVPWGKLLKKTLIGTIRFDKTMKIGEDTKFIFEYLKNVKSISVNQKAAYYWRKSLVSDGVKYKQTASQSVNCVYQIFKAYKELDVTCPALESFLWFYFYGLAHADIYKRPSDWYKDQRIQVIWKSIRGHLSLKGKIRATVESLTVGRMAMQILRYVKGMLVSSRC